MNEVNIVLNGKIVKGSKNETILSVARRNGYNIPTLCNDDRLEPYSSCYVCVVEIEGLRALQPACSTRIAEGMKIETNNGKVYKARKTALELLLSNHYADCTGPCKQTCPAGVDVQGYISLIEKGMYHEAVALIKETNPLPAICGRVCVRPCEAACRRNLLEEGTGVGIDYLKRFAADQDLLSPEKYRPVIKPSTGKKVAVIGAGPGGLSAAFFLQKEGHQVDIYEAAPYAGGWLRYGIPEYRLPNDIIQKEVDNITEMGVKIFYNQKLGENLSYKGLKFKYNSIVLAIGSQKGTSIGCEGDDAGNVLSGIDFLKTMELTGKRYDFNNKTVAVIGGGNTAMDCCRSSMRCGAKKIYIIYRRTEKEMPANPIEIHESKLEGVEYMFLTAPVKVNKDEAGNIKSLRCVKMELGEPDASGRRRPVVVEGSEFDVDMDYAIAAIGQKTIAEFVSEVNAATNNGELKTTKWGDIEADPATLQTGVARIFACGDGVTGPATLIQAVAQARIAARSCNQFLSGLPLEPERKEFISKKENFRIQKTEEYVEKFLTQMREEMPTLEPLARKNFSEVELGYEGEEVALHETQRCLECGCVEYYTCDLKKFATEYDADQTKFAGNFKEREIDFRHPFIEIDNNKCVLCSRCIRICREVVGANALGLVNRGFETYVAPSMGDKLQDTLCESCGLCISACPTAAITENVIFKPGPVKLEKAETICNYCAVGCAINLHHKNGFVMQVTGGKGKVNKDGNLCKYPKFGYHYINDHSRIVKPLLKKGDTFTEISFKEAYELIFQKIKSVKPDENAFFAGARLSNEELYLVQKLARAGCKTNNIASFHYLGRGDGYLRNADANVPFHQLKEASRIYLIGSEINRDNAVAGFFVNNARFTKNIPVELFTTMDNSPMKHKVDRQTRISSYYYFIKAINYYLLAKGKENVMFIKDNCLDLDTYKKALLGENYESLVKLSGVSDKKYLESFAEELNNEMNAILVFSEKELSSNACTEMVNLAIITGKIGKTANGIISLKEKNNAQGLMDMGVFSKIGIGGIPITDSDLQKKLMAKWNLSDLAQTVNEDQKQLLENGSVKNLFIFGEDPLGCAVDKNVVNNWLDKADFLVVQDYFMTETAGKADLILPASLPAETGGSYTNTQKIIQKFDKCLPPKIEDDNIKQLLALLNKFNRSDLSDVVDVMMEAISLLPVCLDGRKHILVTTDKDNSCRMFDHGGDSVVKYFDTGL
ncbi:MAG TPA: FAD-dependent oxidoreductase [Bacteroidales bacterium]|nr:FAD-dependent oxidoreductase [Bacteroidales bacterium]